MESGWISFALYAQTQTNDKPKFSSQRNFAHTGTWNGSVVNMWWVFCDWSTTVWL